MARNACHIYREIILMARNALILDINLGFVAVVFWAPWKVVCYWSFTVLTSFADGGDGHHTWRVAANVLGKKLTADKG